MARPCFPLREGPRDLPSRRRVRIAHEVPHLSGPVPQLPTLQKFSECGQGGEAGDAKTIPRRVPGEALEQRRRFGRDSGWELRGAAWAHWMISNDTTTTDDDDRRPFRLIPSDLRSCARLSDRSDLQRRRKTLPNIRCSSQTTTTTTIQQRYLRRTSLHDVTPHSQQSNRGLNRCVFASTSGLARPASAAQGIIQCTDTRHLVDSAVGHWLPLNFKSEYATHLSLVLDSSTFAQNDSTPQ